MHRLSLGAGVATLLLISTLVFAAEPNEVEDPFPTHQSLATGVNFWIDVYSKFSTRSGILHDADDLSIIYEVLTLEDPITGRRSNRNKIKERRTYYQNILRGILAKDLQNLAPDENAVFARFPAPVSRERIREAIASLRFQLGQKDRFFEGLVRSGAYIDRIRETLKNEGLPEDIAYLPHVESSFQYNAYSKYGAAGIWQFMRSSARRFIKVNYAVDERFDPLLATWAAARYLKSDYETLKSWPLTILAYNHGVQSVKRAVATLSTTDIYEILVQYQAHRFGFASKNFYLEFLAAREVAKNYKKYFGEIQMLPPANYEIVTVEKPISVGSFVKQSRIPLDVFAKANPSLRPPVIRGYRRIPEGHSIYLPKDYISAAKAVNYSVAKAEEPVEAVAKAETVVAPLPVLQPLRVEEANAVSLLFTKERDLRFLKVNENEKIGWIKVGVSETLGHYAEWAKISASEIRRLNGFRSGRAIRMGQALKITLGHTTQEQFERERLEYHRSLEEDFYANYTVKGTIDHRIRPGENLWKIGKEVYDIPEWLIEKYNLGTDWDRVIPGMVVKIPVIEGRNANMNVQLN